jgi:hypothetical protein
LYYQEFSQRSIDAGHTLTAKAYQSCTVGINTINLSDKISFELFPNPSVNGSSTIRFNNNVKGNVTVHDITGKMIYQIQLNNQSVAELSSANLSSSIYLVTVNTDKGTATTKWIIN